MGILSKLFSTPDIVETGTKAVDAVFLTDEERTEYFLKFVEASLPMNVSRRIIASGVTALWAISGIVAIVAILMRSPQIEPLIGFLNVYVMPPFTVLTSWYFWKRITK